MNITKENIINELKQDPKLVDKLIKYVEKLEKFKEEGSTTKWFSKEFILTLENAEMKASMNSF